MTHGIIKLNGGNKLEETVKPGIHHRDPHGNIPLERPVPQHQDPNYQGGHNLGSTPIASPIEPPAMDYSNSGHYKAPTGNIPTVVPACPVVDQTDIPGNYYG